jgi:hypothetical protein
LTTEFAGSYSV